MTAVFAHPDDETYATGATLARYSAEGVRCSLYCATNGDAGKSSGIPISSGEELGAIRRVELKAACGVLGIERVEFGDHGDGRLGQADEQQVIGEIVRLIRRERPDVVLTFGPEGAASEHGDHKAISSLARRAFECAGSLDEFPEQLMGSVRPHQARRLCFVTWPAPQPSDLYQVAGQPAHVRIDARHWNGKKLEAYLTHRSQRQHQANFERYALVDAECYSVAAGVPAPSGAADLFSGLRHPRSRGPAKGPGRLCHLHRGSTG